MSRSRKTPSQLEANRIEKERRVLREQLLERQRISKELEKQRRAEARQRDVAERARLAVIARKAAARERERVAADRRAIAESNRRQRQREAEARRAQVHREAEERRAQIRLDRERDEERREALSPVQRHLEDLERFNLQSTLSYLGEWTYVCDRCGALHWLSEKLSNSPKRDPKFSKCCSKGKVKVPKLSGRCPPLERWLDDQTPRGKAFRADIQKYNNCFAFTSIGMKQDFDTWGPRGIYNLRVSGRVTHRIGYFEPNDGEEHRFAQIYMLDDERAVEVRMNHILRRMDTRIGLDREIVVQLQQYFSRNNYYAREYRTAQERFLESPDATVLSIRQVEGGPDPRRYNMPRDNTEIAAVFIGEAEKQDRGRDLWIQRKGNGPPFQVSELHKTYLALHFPLIHPHGEDGWHTLIPITDVAQEAGEEDSSADEAVAEPEAHKRVMQRMWIAYHIHARKRWDDVRKVFMEQEEPSILLRAAAVFD